ncbi:MAG TPA: hypothetical protein VIS06_02160 [Mycobacteriales bacterium]
MARTLLKELVEDRHLREVRQFNRAYDRVAAQFDPDLVGTGPSRKQLDRWLNGRLVSKPHAYHCQVLERMFPGHPTTELFGPSRQDRAAPVEPAPTGRGRDEEAATNRRDAFRAGGATMAGLVLHQVISEPDQMHAALDTGSVGEGRLAYLEHTADDLGRRMVTVPRGSLLADALGAFGSVRTLVREPQRTADRVRLIRTGAKLATLVGEILFGENQLGPARQWSIIGYRAATDIGDRRLADICLAKQSNVPAYSGDPRGVLALVDPRLDGTPPAASPGVAALWAAKARAHAMLGENIAFRHAVNRSRQVLDTAPDEPDTPTDFTFPSRRLGFYESTGFVRLDDAESALEAADRALTQYETGIYSSEPAMIRLDKAIVHARSGEVPEACRIATEALTDRDSHPASIVLVRAAEFDRMLGADTSAPVREWREVLHQFGPPDRPGGSSGNRVLA